MNGYPVTSTASAVVFERHVRRLNWIRFLRPASWLFRFADLEVVALWLRFRWLWRIKVVEGLRAREIRRMLEPVWFAALA